MEPMGECKVLGSSIRFISTSASHDQSLLKFSEESQMALDISYYDNLDIRRFSSGPCHKSTGCLFQLLLKEQFRLSPKLMLLSS
jgi:hypothetical protein